MLGKLRPIPLVLFGFFLFVLAAHAQDGLSGKEFWLAFPQNARFEHYEGLRFTLYVVGSPGTKGVLTEYANGKETAFEIGASSIDELSIDTVCEMLKQGVHRSAIHVKTSNDVTIVAVSHRPASMDSYAAIPADLCGVEYVAIGYDCVPDAAEFSTQCDVIATADHTAVSIDYPLGLGIAPFIRTAVLNLGEVLHLGGSELGKDFTGARIHANKPVGVITGHTCAEVPTGVRYCDMLMEMIPPTNALGRHYIVGTFKWQRANSIRVVAVDDSTLVSLSGRSVARINRGEYYQNDSVGNLCSLDASKPVYAMQYVHSSEDNHGEYGTADPAMVTLVPEERMVTSVKSAIPHDRYPIPDFMTRIDQLDSDWYTFLSIVTRFADRGNMRLNGQEIEASSFVQIPGSEFGFSTLWVKPGLVTLEGAPFAAYMFGVGMRTLGFESTAHPLGMRLR